MRSQIKAVIFDMDGVLIDSEPLWRMAMIKGFKDIGIPFAEDDCRKTTGLRFIEVVEFWFDYYKITTISTTDFENNVTTNLIDLIFTNGREMVGVLEILTYLKHQSIKIGLATSSSEKLMNSVLQKLGINSYFNSTVSAQFLQYGKPHPEVYLLCAKQLQIKPANCLVIEDSVNGIIAGKAAQMPVLGLLYEENRNNLKFNVADFTCKNMNDALILIKQLN